jgi:hypothetical protein
VGGIALFSSAESVKSMTIFHFRKYGTAKFSPGRKRKRTKILYSKLVSKK